MAAAVVLAGLLFFGVLFTPAYVRNYKLQSFVAALPQQAGADLPDARLREMIVTKAHEIGVPLEAGEIDIARSATGGHVEGIKVHYQVRVDFPGYTVNLHFYPGAGSQ